MSVVGFNYARKIKGNPRNTSESASDKVNSPSERTLSAGFTLLLEPQNSAFTLKIHTELWVKCVDEDFPYNTKQKTRKPLTLVLDTPST